MVQPNLDPTYALAKDISDAQARIGRLEQADITIAGLHDVAITSPTNTQVLTYNTALQKWINATGGGGGASFTVSATAPASPVNGAGWYNLTNGYIFFYINDGNSSQWVQDTSIANDAGYESRLTALETFNTVAQPVSVGGTGASTLFAGGYLKGAGTSAITSQTGIPANDITSGTLGVPRGGTGATTLTSGGYLKGAGTAAVTSQTGIPATDITSGILSTSVLPTIPIANGGTGGTTGAGLVPVIPTNVYVSSGSASIASTGIITFTNVTAVSFAGAFGTLERYRVDISGYSGPGNYLNLRGATSGTGNSAAAYYEGGLYRQGGAVGIWTNQSGATTMQVGYIPGSEWWNSTVEVMNPNNNNAPCFINRAFYMGGAGTTVISDGKFNGTGVFDGLQFFSSSGGTFSGTIRIFAFRK